MAEIMCGRKVVRHSPARVGKKISILMHEGKKQDEAVATALSMERAHRLTDAGGYIHAKKKRTKL